MWPESFSQSLEIDVSRETREKLEIYHALLLKWQKAINLISPKTIDEAWIRHFVDSAQIAKYVSRESKTIADLGSGAGFPGLVLAMLRPDLNIHLVESDERKCQFLRTVSRETSVDVTVHNVRIEDATNGISPDIVTARALADLTLLLEYVQPWVEANPALSCLFLKGARAEAELSEARERGFAFDSTLHVSLTDPQARIVNLQNIIPKSGA